MTARYTRTGYVLIQARPFSARTHNLSIYLHAPTANPIGDTPIIPQTLYD